MIKLTIVETEHGLAVEYPSHLYRFLLGDGRTIDVHAYRDDSDLRAAVCAHTKAVIVGGVEVGHG